MGVLVRPAGQTSWTDQLDGPAGRTSSFYLKPWPVCIFEDFLFSLYIVTASESDEGLVCLKINDSFLYPPIPMEPFWTAEGLNGSKQVSVGFSRSQQDITGISGSQQVLKGLDRS